MRFTHRGVINLCVSYDKIGNMFLIFILSYSYETDLTLDAFAPFYNSFQYFVLTCKAEI